MNSGAIDQRAIPLLTDKLVPDGRPQAFRRNGNVLYFLKEVDRATEPLVTNVKRRSIQEKLYSNTQWKVESGVITTSATNFAVGQSYTLTFADQKMIWTGTEGQGVIVYERI